MSPVVFLDNLTSSLFIEDRAETARYETALRSLLKRALDERQSAELIADRARCLDEEASFR